MESYPFPFYSRFSIIISGKYKLIKKIGSGSFGEIYTAENIHSGDEVAIKLENQSARHLQLQYESKIYRILQNGPGIPKAHYYGSEGSFNVLVIDLLGTLKILLSVYKSIYRDKCVQ